MKPPLRITCLLLYISIVTNIQGQTPLKFRDTTIQGPQTFAIVVGVSKYKYVKPLTYADKDAILFSDYLKSPGGGSLNGDNIFMLLNEEASNSNFWTKGFQWLKAKRLQKGDKLFIYLAGHGDAIDQDQFFFLGYDCNPEGDKNNYLVAGTIQLFNLKKKISNETAKGVEVFFIMDACRSNELPGGVSGQSFLNTAISEKKVGEIIMLATGAGQESLEDKSIGTGHGLFTYYLVDGLSGVADTDGTPDFKVTFSEIQKYVDKNVPSVAKERFKRSQDPYFCCNENSEKVISNVDPTYLQKWLQTKRAQNSGGNSFNGIIKSGSRYYYADTLLVETYNQFNRAIKNNNIVGNKSAEDYFQQLNTKYPGNPYTLDAKSSLTVKYIDFAQAKVDRYLSCSDDLSAKQKQENTEAATRLEKAIDYVREDDADFANSLRGRLFLLKASGNNSSADFSFQSAYSALSIDPNGAYIQNKLALLHLDNNNKDSALFYADKAVRTAPNWRCALTTLALVQNATNKNPDNKNVKKNSPFRKVSFGGKIGGGLNQSNPTYSGNVNSGYDDVRSNTAPAFDLGLIIQVNIGNTIFIRPSVTVSSGNTDIDFIRRPSTGGQEIVQTIGLKNTFANIEVPLIFRFSTKNVSPYIMLGPSFSYQVSQDNNTADVLLVKKSILSGNGGFGIDIGLGKSGLSLSPEVKYTAGFSDIKDPNSNTPFSLAISSLKRNIFSFNLYLRKR